MPKVPNIVAVIAIGTLFLVVTPMALGQDDKIAFVELGVADGLPEEMVKVILQDDQGFIWCATQNGVVRYDGYEMKVFRATSDPGDTAGLRLRNISGMIKSRTGKFWLSTAREPGGIASYDPRTEQFRNYLPDPEDPSGIPFVWCDVIFQDIRGDVWFANFARDTMLTCRLNPETGVVSTYPFMIRLDRNDRPEVGSLSLQEVRGDSSVWLLDRSGNLRRLNRSADTFEIVIPKDSARTKFSTPEELVALGPMITKDYEFIDTQLGLSGRHSFFVWDALNQESIESYHFVPEFDSSLWPEPFYDLTLDSKNRFWAFHRGGNISIIDRETNSNTKLSYRDIRPNIAGMPDTVVTFFVYSSYDNYNDIWLYACEDWSLQVKAFVRYNVPSETFFFYNLYFNDLNNPRPLTGRRFEHQLFQDKYGLLWFRTRPYFYKQAPKRRRLQLYQHAPGISSSLPSDTIYQLLEDSRQRLWVRTNEGLALYNNAIDGFKRILHGNRKQDLSGTHVTGVYESPTSRVWVMTNDGINLLDDNDISFTKIPVGEAGMKPLVLTMMEDRKQRLWVSVSGHGVYLLDSSFRLLRHFSPDNLDPTALSSNYISHLYEDRRGQIWLGDERENRYGLFRLNANETGFVHYHTGGSNAIINNEVKFFAEDADDRLWLGTDGGLIRYDFDNDTFILYGNQLDMPSVLGYAFDKSGNFWVTTYSGGGLVLVDPENGQIETYSEEAGLLHNDASHVRSIPVDNYGNMWLPTQRGLSSFDPTTRTFTNYFESDGFQPYGRFYQAVKTRDGSIWIGGYNGLNRIDPAALIVKDSTRPDVWITGMTVMDTLYSAPDGSIFNQAVSYTDNIELKHSQNDIGFEFVALHYAEPKDNQYSWILENFDDKWSAPSTDRKVSYSNLPPGTYTFRVKGSNADGIWNEEGDFLTVVINPPWWGTWWFRVSAFLVILLGTGKYVQDKVNKSRRERERLEAKVRERTQTIREQAEQLKELDEIKTRVYTNITHEFRTPLTVISGMTEMIEGNEQIKRLIRANSDQLLNLVNQLLELRKLRSGKLPLNPICADIIQYVTYIFESFRSIAERKELNLQFESNVESLEMDYDPEKLLRIISNLLSNAIKFTPEGGEILLRIEHTDANSKEKMSISVSDNGIGIPHELHNTIFDRFYQVDQGTSRLGEGTGIGLSLCKELVDLMNGKIRVASKPDQGSTFVVELPVTRDAEKQDMHSFRGLHGKLALMGSELRSAEFVPVEVDSEVTDEDRPVALVVEDNSDVIQFIHACLEPLYSVHITRNGQEGIEKAFEIIPDIIVSDVMMPQKDGFELCETVKNDPRTSHIPIILLTALAEVKSRISGLKRGADAYIAKPFLKEELLVHMENLLEVRRSLVKRYASMELAPTEDINIKTEDSFMLNLRDVIHEHMHDPTFTVEQLSQLMGVSRAQLHRKLIALSGMSANKLIREARLNKAKVLLLDPDLNISEVAYDIGFADPAYFSRVFHNEVGVSPTTFIKHKGYIR